jgi:hypothetical protein
MRRDPTTSVPVTRFERPVRVVVLTVVLLVAVVGIALGLYHEHYREWPLESTPDRLAFCGREYHRFTHVSAVDVRRERGMFLAFRYDPPLNPGHDVYSTSEQTEPGRDPQSPGTLCTTALFLHDGDHYIEYFMCCGP